MNNAIFEPPPLTVWLYHEIDSLKGENKDFTLIKPFNSDPLIWHLHALFIVSTHMFRFLL